MEPVLGAKKYDRVIPILVQNQEFLRSDDFRLLLGTGDDLPGVVAAAYAKFVGKRLSSSETKKDTKLIHPLDLFAAWHDSDVNTMLEDEVFEQFAADGNLNKVASLMGPDLRELLSNWLSK